LGCKIIASNAEVILFFFLQKLQSRATRMLVGSGKKVKGGFQKIKLMQ
jgi:hypothetical protein